MLLTCLFRLFKKENNGTAQPFLKNEEKSKMLGGYCVLEKKTRAIVFCDRWEVKHRATCINGFIRVTKYVISSQSVGEIIFELNTQKKGLVFFVSLFFPLSSFLFPVQGVPLVITEQSAVELGLMLLFYGLYYGVLSRDTAQLCTKEIANTLGFFVEDGLARKNIPSHICAVCNELLTYRDEVSSQRTTERRGHLLRHLQQRGHPTAASVDTKSDNNTSTTMQVAEQMVEKVASKLGLSKKKCYLKKINKIKKLIHKYNK
ncbi:putative RING finger protein [Reticulomyxa filosa]|uniref:Putative RING finger protein n=1 Tax=Reticulomyxa filosa TaxID=46433 RepID=X6MMM8_RETFI|nr:putative RING finger protein [Reticulomyxa filosa]|eukprot:ETO14697.1 putative RING finger protein [Reticulomyxa filosa]